MKKVDALSYEQPSTANNKHTNMAPNEPARPIFGRKWPKVPIMILYFDIWGQKSIYVLSTEHIIVTTGLQLSPLYPPPKKFCFRGTGRLPWHIPNFGYFWGVARQNFGPRSTKLASHFNFQTLLPTQSRP